jgi:hypothetical protein
MPAKMDAEASPPRRDSQPWSVFSALDRLLNKWFFSQWKREDPSNLSPKEAKDRALHARVSLPRAPGSRVTRASNSVAQEDFFDPEEVLPARVRRSMLDEERPLFGKINFSNEQSEPERYSEGKPRHSKSQVLSTETVPQSRASYHAPEAQSLLNTGVSAIHRQSRIPATNYDECGDFDVVKGSYIPPRSSFVHREERPPSKVKKLFAFYRGMFRESINAYDDMRKTQGKSSRGLRDYLLELAAVCHKPVPRKETDRGFVPLHLSSVQTLLEQEQVPIELEMKDRINAFRRESIMHRQLQRKNNRRPVPTALEQPLETKRRKTNTISLIDLVGPEYRDQIVSPPQPRREGISPFQTDPEPSHPSDANSTGSFGGLRSTHQSFGPSDKFLNKVEDTAITNRQSILGKTDSELRATELLRKNVKSMSLSTIRETEEMSEKPALSPAPPKREQSKPIAEDEKDSNSNSISIVVVPESKKEAHTGPISFPVPAIAKPQPASSSSGLSNYPSVPPPLGVSTTVTNYDIKIQSSSSNSQHSAQLPPLPNSTSTLRQPPTPLDTVQKSILLHASDTAPSPVPSPAATSNTVLVPNPQPTTVSTTVSFTQVLTGPPPSPTTPTLSTQPTPEKPAEVKSSVSTGEGFFSSRLHAGLTSKDQNQEAQKPSLFSNNPTINASQATSVNTTLPSATSNYAPLTAAAIKSPSKQSPKQNIPPNTISETTKVEFLPQKPPSVRDLSQNQAEAPPTNRATSFFDYRPSSGEVPPIKVQDQSQPAPKPADKPNPFVLPSTNTPTTFVKAGGLLSSIIDQKSSKSLFFSGENKDQNKPEAAGQGQKTSLFDKTEKLNQSAATSGFFDRLANNSQQASSSNNDNKQPFAHLASSTSQPTRSNFFSNLPDTSRSTSIFDRSGTDATAAPSTGFFSKQPQSQSQSSFFEKSANNATQNNGGGTSGFFGAGRSSMENENNSARGGGFWGGGGNDGRGNNGNNASSSSSSFFAGLSQRNNNNDGGRQEGGGGGRESGNFFSRRDDNSNQGGSYFNSSAQPTGNSFLGAGQSNPFLQSTNNQQSSSLFGNGSSRQNNNNNKNKKNKDPMQRSFY